MSKIWIYGWPYSSSKIRRQFYRSERKKSDRKKKQKAMQCGELRISSYPMLFFERIFKFHQCSTVVKYVFFTGSKEIEVYTENRKKEDPKSIGDWFEKTQSRRLSQRKMIIWYREVRRMIYKNGRVQKK